MVQCIRKWFGCLPLTATVTNTLRSAMRKLGVSTQAQLVTKLHSMELPSQERIQ
jgi:hypothetical protein